MLRITELRLPLDHSDEELAAAIARRLSIGRRDLLSWSIFRRSPDARRSGEIALSYHVDVDTPREAEVLARLERDPNVGPTPDTEYRFDVRAPHDLELRPVVVGMGLSLAAMVAAAVGLLPPAAGAILQEVIDILAIGIALRAVLPGKVHTIAMPPADIAIAHELKVEHDAVLAVVEQIRAVADTLSTQNCDLAPAHTLFDRLEGELLPHERADEALLVPLVDRALGSSDTTAAMSRTHAEIEHQVSRLRRLLTDLDNDTVQPEDVVELRRLLYGLYAVLRLHNAQEEEGAFSLVPAGVARGTGN